jgi:hypothetical protein
MDASETFLRFAAECELMAKVSSTAEGRSTWRGMAERWVRCAELSQQQSLSARTRPVTRRRQPEHGFLQ